MYITHAHSGPTRFPALGDFVLGLRDAFAALLRRCGAVKKHEEQSFILSMIAHQFMAGTSPSPETPPPTASELAATDAFFTRAAAEASEFFAAPDALLKTSAPAALLKTCGQHCEGNGCRKMVSKHCRRLVCPTCMPPQSFMKCAAGCNAYIHIGCIDCTGMHVVASQSWMCNSCTSVSGEAEEPAPTCIDGCTHDGKERFDDEDAAYSQLRSRGFKISTRYNDTIQWICTHCKTTFPCKALKDGSAKWGVTSANVRHLANCTKVILPATQPDDVRMIRYLHDFANYHGLQEFIETMGATGEVRIDQLYRSCQKTFNVHVDKSLLFRTAKNAEEEMFGKTVSDVLELEKMCQRVKGEGGNLTLVRGT